MATPAQPPLPRRIGHDAIADVVQFVERFDAELDHATDHRRQFPDLPDAADDAAAEPEPARSAGHQSVHPAARRIRAASSSSSRPTIRCPRWCRCSRPRRRRRRCNSSARPRWSTATPRRSSNSQATWELNVPSTSTVNDHHRQRHRTDRVHRQLLRRNAGNNQPFAWNGQGNDGTQWPDGQYTLTATAHRQLRQLGRRHDPGSGHRQLGRPHPIAAAAHRSTARPTP